MGAARTLPHMLTPLRCSRTKPHRCGHAWFTDAAGKYPVCPKCRTSVSRANTLRLVWPHEERPDGLHGWISVDVTRYHREPILVLNVASDDLVAGETIRLVEATLLDPRRFGLRSFDLMDAISEAGGNVTVEGQYPVNGTIMRAVALAMGHGDPGTEAEPDPAATMADRPIQIGETLERGDAEPDDGEPDSGEAVFARVQAGETSLEAAAEELGIDLAEAGRRYYQTPEPVEDGDAAAPTEE